MSDYDVTNPTKPTIVKDPNAQLDYTWDWSTWLADSDPDDTIVSHQITLSGSPTASVVTSMAVGGRVTAMIAGGAVGEKVAATCRITTAGGRIDDRTLYLKIRER